MVKKYDPVFRVYQQVRGWQRIIVMIPAATTVWIDTGIHPCVLGTRMFWGSWRSRVSYLTEKETIENFRQRMSDIRVKYVEDPTVVIDKRCYVSMDKSSQVTPPGQEVKLREDGETTLRFPMERGRIQVKLAGAQPSDKGVVWIEFLTQMVADDDWFIFQDVANSIEVYDLNLDQFPNPREPNPFADVQPDKKL